jgi:hypothetical protein
MDARLQMQDPRHQYPEPPFPTQPQPASGVAAQMMPKPDHGESSYRGSGKLAGRKALITGGDSAIAFEREGADVAIVRLSSEEEDATQVVRLIGAEGRKAVAIAGDIKDRPFCEQAVADAVDALGGLEILVNNAAKQETRPHIGETPRAMCASPRGTAPVSNSTSRTMPVAYPSDVVFRVL